MAAFPFIILTRLSCQQNVYNNVKSSLNLFTLIMQIDPIFEYNQFHILYIPSYKPPVACTHHSKRTWLRKDFFVFLFVLDFGLTKMFTIIREFGPKTVNVDTITFAFQRKGQKGKWLEKQIQNNKSRNSCNCCGMKNIIHGVKKPNLKFICCLFANGI